MNQPPQPPQRPFQISLRALFLCVSYFAVASGLAVIWNPGILVPMVGVFLTWAAYRGYLWRLQSASARPRMFSLTWILFLISLGLPAMTIEGCSPPPTASYGWQVAWMGIGVTWFGIERIASSEVVEGLKVIASSSFYNLPNVMIAASPLLYYLHRRQRIGELSPLWGCAAVSSWSWGPIASSDLKIGYFVWAAALTVEFLRRQVTIRTMVVMALCVVALYLLSLTG